VKYRKRPLVVEAERFDGTLECAMRICGPGGTPDLYYGNPEPGDWSLVIFVVTPEGTMKAEAGSWIVTGIQGERYPVKSDIFQATYEPCDPPAVGHPEGVQLGGFAPAGPGDRTLPAGPISEGR
jgi:hypothetical protein